MTELIIDTPNIMDHVKDMFYTTGIDFVPHDRCENVLIVHEEDEDGIERILKDQRIEFQWAVDDDYRAELAED